MPDVSIRPVAATDGEALVAANRASAALHHPWSHPFTDKVGFDRYLATLDGETNVGMVAVEIANNALTGVFTLSQIVRGPLQSAYLGFYGLQGQAGRGLMTRALRLVVGHAFSDLGLHRIEANVQPGNMRSLALLARAGFRKEGFSPRYLFLDGEWRDHERWAILADD